MASPGPHDIDIYQGDDWSETYRLKADGTNYTNLTGSTPKGQIRSTAASATVLAEMAFTLANQGTTPGQWTMSLTDTQTTALAAGTYVYDIEITDSGGNTLTWLKGAVNVTAQVTR